MSAPTFAERVAQAEAEIEARLRAELSPLSLEMSHNERVARSEAQSRYLTELHQARAWARTMRPGDRPPSRFPELRRAADASQEEPAPVEGAVYAHPTAGAPAYRKRGYWPIPVIGKAIPPSGATGAGGTVTDEKVTAWLTAQPGDNLAIRHEHTVAIDLDDYVKGETRKEGVRHLREFAARHGLGPLPATWSSTARGADAAARQHFYRVPPGVRLAGKPCQDVEVCQRGHRFSVVAPSVHPDTGARYRWYLPGEPGIPPTSGPVTVELPPSPGELPLLPKDWAAVLHMKAGRAPSPTSSISTSEAETLAATFPPGPPSPKVSRALEHAREQHPGHVETQAMLFHGFRLGLEGEPGAAELLGLVDDRHREYLTELDDPRRGMAEADRLVADTAAAALAARRRALRGLR